MPEYQRALLLHLQDFLTPQRKQKFTEVLHERTRKITLVLVDLFQEHNASAVLRSCEAFGIQDVYVVESEHEFSPKQDIAMGTDRWLTIHRYSGPYGLDRCFLDLDSRGYRTVATVLRDESCSLYDLEIHPSQPLAIFFGTEKEGLPTAVLERVDVQTLIPMSGFVESLNVSVAAALTLQTLTQKLKQNNSDWHLTSTEQQQLWIDWSRTTIPNCSAIEARFQSNWKEPGSPQDQS